MAEEQIKDTQSEPIPPLENIYFLTINVVSASNLQKADFSGSSDPFCKVIANQQSWITKTIDANINPKWNEETQFVFFNPTEEIRFEVYDADQNSKSDLLGYCKLKTKDFFAASSDGFSGDIKLEKCKKKGSTINVQVNGRLIRPLELEKRCEKLETECKNQENEIAEKKNEIGELMKKTGTLADRKNNLAGQKQQLTDELTQIKEFIDNCKKENDKKQNEITQLKRKKTDYGGKINKKQQDLDNKKTECANEQNKLNQVKEQYKQLQKDVQEKRNQLDSTY
eukprot:547008_1